MINKKCVFWVIIGKMILFSQLVFSTEPTTETESNKRDISLQQTTDKPEITLPQSAHVEDISTFLSEHLKAKKEHVFNLLKLYKDDRRKEYPFKKFIVKCYQDLENGKLSFHEIDELLIDIPALEWEVSPKRIVEDRELFQLLLTVYEKGDTVLRVSALYGMHYFPKSFMEEHIDVLMAPFLADEDVFGERGLLMIPLSDKTKEKYKTFLEKQIKKEKAAYEKNQNTEQYKSGPMFFKLDMLHYCGMLGDQSSIQELIKIYKNLKWTDPWDADASQAMTSLLDIGTRDCLVAVLERFHENIGAPDYSGTSPRFTILQALWCKYRNDPFFAKYSRYLMPPLAGWVLDGEIGGEAGVRELYKGLIKWAKDNLQYDLNLDDADPKIKANIVDKYNLPTE